MNKKLVYAAAAIAITAALIGVGIATTTNSNTVFAQSHHQCNLPNGGSFPGQGSNSNPISEGGGCPNGLTSGLGIGNN
jgi:hypothetical protein